MWTINIVLLIFVVSLRGAEGMKVSFFSPSSPLEKRLLIRYQTLDALQYLLRKLLSNELNSRVILELDADGFRSRRRSDLEQRARTLAAEVKSGGKSRTLPAMGPAERRIVHLALQSDPDIRSRSVGEGIFKKVLIHAPGKSRRRRKR